MFLQVLWIMMWELSPPQDFLQVDIALHPHLLQLGLQNLISTSDEIICELRTAKNRCIVCWDGGR